MDMLAKLYYDPYAAVLREYVSNAHDANIEANADKHICTAIYGLKPHLRTKTILNAKCTALANATTLMAIALKTKT